MSIAIFSSWFWYAIFATFSLGTMTAIIGSLKQVSAPLSLFFVGCVFVPWYTWFGLGNVDIVNRAMKTLLVVILMVAILLYITASTKLLFNQIMLLLFCGVLSAIGNQFLFLAAQQAPNPGFPIAIFANYAIITTLVSLLITEDSGLIKWVGLNSFKLGISDFTLLHWLGIAFGFLCVLCFALVRAS